MGDGLKKSKKRYRLTDSNTLDLEGLGLPSMAEKEKATPGQCPFLAPSFPDKTFSCIHVGTIIANGEFLIPGVECAGEYWQCARYLLNIKICPSNGKSDPHLEEGLQMSASLLECDLVKMFPIPEQMKLVDGERVFDDERRR